MDDFLQKAFIVLFGAIGVGIFFLIILLKLDIMTKKAEADTKNFSAEADWEGYLYQKTAREVLAKKDPKDHTADHKKSDISELK